MTINEKIEKIADMLDLEPEDIKEDANLSDYEEWDSVARLSFIALMDEKFDKAVSGADIRNLVTIKDMLSIMK